LDHKITRHVIDRYYAKFGNARASLRYLEKATGATRANIIDSIRRITENGVIRVIRQGIGTRPTEYDLNFEFASKSPSGIADDTSSGIADSTSSASSGIVDNTESYLRNMSTDMLTVSRNEDTHAVPTAPAVGGLGAATAAAAWDPEAQPIRFEELWAAFPRKRQRAKAKAEYDKLEPNEALHADLVTAATALAAHHEKNGTEKKWWKHLHSWLAQECYFEDLPEPYENPKEAAIARSKENGPRKAIRQDQ
jgi:DNA-binding Lrp family transcriptional regulator